MAHGILYAAAIFGLILFSHSVALAGEDGFQQKPWIQVSHDQAFTLAPVLTYGPLFNTAALAARAAWLRSRGSATRSGTSWTAEAGQDFLKERLRAEVGYGLFLDWSKDYGDNIFANSGGLRFGYLYQNGPGGSRHFTTVSLISFVDVLTFRFVVPVGSQNLDGTQFEIAFSLLPEVYGVAVSQHHGR